MNLKPIEPGCMAIKIASRITEHVGMTVHVLDRVPVGELARTPDGWVVSCEPGCWHIEIPAYPPPGSRQWICHEETLMRVDPDDDVEQEQVDELLEVDA